MQFEAYVILFLLVLFINVVPAFMPPTWIILSFIFVQYHLDFIPTVVLGVIAATTGRVFLALISKRWVRKILPKGFLGNYEYLGKFFEKNQKFTIPIVLGYAFSPISSNSLFIMAGLSDVQLHIIAFSFFIGRLFTYSFWVTTSHQISERLDEIFAGGFSGQAVASAFVSLLIVVVIGKINWSKIIRLKKK